MRGDCLHARVQRAAVACTRASTLMGRARHTQAPTPTWLPSTVSTTSGRLSVTCCWLTSVAAEASLSDALPSTAPSRSLMVPWMSLTNCTPRRARWQQMGRDRHRDAWWRGWRGPERGSECNHSARGDRSRYPSACSPPCAPSDHSTTIHTSRPFVSGRPAHLIRNPGRGPLLRAGEIRLIGEGKQG